MSPIDAAARSLIAAHPDQVDARLRRIVTDAGGRLLLLCQSCWCGGLGLGSCCRFRFEQGRRSLSPRLAVRTG
ncbi:hypothetical protein HCN51_43935 [Nonomuraea sp. FMUSA5-5]|uniref:Uncharacterized protein n=1 Tax=Nonomuraea composti TaxID=2720023 RepID=A0ABX1BEZ2_9ACTN|nr:hypothetical protein [Nonomuraea sp. FMUSA5-5]NJP96310.1 hypothetical protein [Nonomuraea sp. FMUSA5-5]